MKQLQKTVFVKTVFNNLKQTVFESNELMTYH